ncbi:MAG: hypothetical protein HY537_08025 [Deltaproteobacteria bacterium]|nr:hypothetical protein [Deltaproteobacteria bacterium]
MNTENIFSKIGGEPKLKVYHFEIFKGVKDEQGTIRRVRSVGRATHVDGQKTFRIKLATLEEVDFYLLPEKKFEGRDFSILRRKQADNLARKFLWNTVGEAKMLEGSNSGLMQLSWDIFGAQDIYMNMQPRFETEETAVAE